MSKKNSLENKRKRREEREVHRFKTERHRQAQRRLEYLAFSPPDTYEELETLVDEALSNAVEE